MIAAVERQAARLFTRDRLEADGYCVIECNCADGDPTFDMVAVPTLRMEEDLRIRLIKIASPQIELHKHGRLVALRRRFPLKTISVEAWVYDENTVLTMVEEVV